MRTTLPRYQEIAEAIRERILRGEVEDSGFVAAEHAIAREFKVSRVTARRASEYLIDLGILVRLPGKGLYLAHKERRLQQPHINLIVENMQWESCREFERGVLSVDNFHCTTLNGNGCIEETLRQMTELVEHPKATDGAIILAWHTPTFFEVAFNIRKAGIPLVIADYASRELQVTGVISDNYRGGQLIGEHLLEMGHKHVAFLGDTFATTVASRLEGLRDALAEGGVALPKSLVFDLLPEHAEDSWTHDITYAMRQICSLPSRPTAIVCSCDAVARGVYAFAKQNQIVIPDHLSVTGFDDDPLSNDLSPTLTTIKQSFYEMGQRANELLWRQRALPEASLETVVVPVKPIYRHSVRNLKENH